MVVGKKGDEIYTDAYGRIKVQFRWDREGTRNEHSSCWIRVRQNLAGGNYGSFFLPRVGQEVVVEFLEGDPDYPLVTGVVYNNDLMPPYKLPDERTKSTIKTNSSKGGKGFNEIRFEDLKDKEQLFIHAQKDQDNRVLNDDKQWVGNDQHKIIKRDLFENIERNKQQVIKGDIKIDHGGIRHEDIESDRFTRIGGDDHLTVDGAVHTEITKDLNQKVSGAQNYEITGKSSLKVDGDLHTKVGGGYAFETGGDIYLKAGGNLVLEAGAKLTIKVGGNFVTVDSAGVAIKGTMVYLNSQGAPASAAAVSVTAPEAVTKPEAAKPAAEADKADPGKDLIRKVKKLSPQALVLKSAAMEGAPFCEKCEEARKTAEKEAKQDGAAGAGATAEGSGSQAAGAAGSAGAGGTATSSAAGTATQTAEDATADAKRTADQAQDTVDDDGLGATGR